MSPTVLGLMLAAVAFPVAQSTAQDALAADATAAAPAADEIDAPALRPTWDEIFRPPSLLGMRPTGAAISADGRFTTYRWAADQGEDPERDTWLVDNASGEARVLFAFDDDVSVRWTKSPSLLLVEDDGWYDLLDVSDEDAVRVPLFEAPRGARLTFLDDGHTLVTSAQPERELWRFDLFDGSRRMLAPDLKARGSWYEVEEDAGLVALFAVPVDDGGDDRSTGSDRDDEQPTGPRLHLVDLTGQAAPRALDVEPGPSADLSPNGLWISLSDSDFDTDRDLIMADYLTTQVTAVPVRDSMAGDPAPEVELRIHDVAADETFDAPLDASDHYYLRGTNWSPDGKLLLVQRISDDFKVRQVIVVDPAARSSRVVFSERDEAWVGGPFGWADFRDDSTEVLFTSERSGFNHVWAVPVAGGELRRITKGDCEVNWCTQLDDSQQVLAIANGVDDPATAQLLLADLDGVTSQRLTGLEGWVSWARVSEDESAVIYRRATLGRPDDLHTMRLDDARSRPISNTVPEALAELGAAAPEIIEYPASDGSGMIRAYLYKPEPFDPWKKYPAVMFVHGAGYLQQVRHSMSAYEVNMLFHQRLARQGFVVIDPDYRHSKGYGRDFRAAIYGFMGGKDLDDCVSGVDYLKTLNYVDTDRVGIYGGSYGGFMVLMALFQQPEVFAAGAALRSVTDWAVYNHWYTNPRLGHPEVDAENYERSSPIHHAEGLTKPLLILHGMKDSNVFAQDSIRLIEKLIELGKDFDAMLYPSQGHGFQDPASWIDEYKRIEALFVDELGAPE